VLTAEINEIENRKTTEKINESKSQFLVKTNKIDETLTKLTKKKEI